MMKANRIKGREINYSKLLSFSSGKSIKTKSDKAEPEREVPAWKREVFLNEQEVAQDNIGENKEGDKDVEEEYESGSGQAERIKALEEVYSHFVCNE